jgi:hypothetical protein
MGQCAKEVGAVDLQTVGGVGDEGVGLVALLTNLAYFQESVSIL